MLLLYVFRFIIIPIYLLQYLIFFSRSFDCLYVRHQSFPEGALERSYTIHFTIKFLIVVESTPGQVNKIKTRNLQEIKIATRTGKSGSDHYSTGTGKSYRNGKKLDQRGQSR